MPPKARPGDRVAVLSPSFAAPGAFPAVHEQAMRRLAEVTGLIPVEYPTTRRLDAHPRERAADLDAAFADPQIRAVLATIGGDDQLTVVPHLNPEPVRADPKPFLGYSDNTNLLSWLWTHGVAGFYGGSTSAPAPPSTPATPPRYGRPCSPGSGCRSPTPGSPRTSAGPGTTRPPSVLDGGILLLETSEEIIPAREAGWILRALGERGLLAAVDGVLVARPPASHLTRRPSDAERAAHRAEQRDTAIDVIGRYNPQAVVCVGVPFGHTRPQWILPYGGEVTLDGARREVWADYR